MLGILFSNPFAFIVLVASLIVSVTIHEFCHAFAADKLGDPTPRSQGRVSLNPLLHLDPVGSIFLLLFGFGWGRPVIFDPYNLRSPRRDAAIIAFAGPLSNVVLALLLAIFMPLIPMPAEILLFLIRINLILAAFNLIPIHPLDGGKVLSALLPRELSFEFDQVLSRYGFIILLLLIFPWAGGSSPILYLLGPVMTFLQTFVFAGASLVQGAFAGI